MSLQSAHDFVSDYDLFAVQNQSILSTNTDLWTILPLATNFSDIWTKIQLPFFQKMDLFWSTQK